MLSASKTISRYVIFALICAVVLTLSACNQLDTRLVGTWYNGITYMQYGEDGTYSMALSYAGIEADPGDWGTFSFDGEKIKFHSADEDGAGCRDKKATYEVTFSSEGETTFTLVEDPCPGRSEMMIYDTWSQYTP